MTIISSKSLLILSIAISGHQLVFAEGTNGKVSQSLSLTVLANKIEENIGDVPQSITVIDSVDIEDKGIQTVGDVIREVPNMNFNSGHGNHVSFRGLTPSVFTNNNPVVIYIDGIPTTDTYAFEASLVNAERIEVLRGPQGALYGKDAIGAVINIVTKEPDTEWHGNVNGELGSHQRRFIGYSTDGALVKEKLFVGVNGQLEARDGWIDNVYQGKDEDANTRDIKRFGGYLLFKPSSNLSTRLNLAHETKDDGWWDGYGQSGGTDLSEFNRNDAENIMFDFDQNEKTTMDSQNLNVAYDAQNFNLQSTTTHKVFKLEGVYDADYGVDPAFAGLTQFNTAETDSVSQELRFASHNSTGFRWVAGLYFDNEERVQAPYGQEFPNYYDSTGDGVADTFAGNFRMNAESDTDSKTMAAFGQLIIPIMEHTELTLGGRYQRIEKDIDLQMYYLPVGQQGEAYFNYQDNRSWNKFLPKIALSQKLSNQWTAYTAYSKGYMPGGFNYFATSGSTYENSFEPQTSDNLEIGIKGQINDVSVAANLFYMDIEDIHVYKSIGTTYLTDNAEKATSKGAELELSWFATDTVQLSAAVGYTDARYDRYDNGSVIFDGRRVADTPNYTAKLGVAYEGLNNWYGRADLYNQGSLFYYDDVQKKLVKRDGYHTIDVRAGYRLDDWDVYGFINNLTDEEYVTSFMSSSLVSIATFGSPRTFGIGTRYTF